MKVVDVEEADGAVRLTVRARRWYWPWSLRTRRFLWNGEAWWHEGHTSKWRFWVAENTEHHVSWQFAARLDRVYDGHCTTQAIIGKLEHQYDNVIKQAL